jgi:hypothetical protein
MPRRSVIAGLDRFRSSLPALTLSRSSLPDFDPATHPFSQEQSIFRKTMDARVEARA